MFYNSNCCTIGSLMNNITKVNIVHKLEQNVCINNYKILPQICSVNYYCKMLFLCFDYNKNLSDTFWISKNYLEKIFDAFEIFWMPCE